VGCDPHFPMARCRPFAESVADARGLPLHVEPELREISFGDWEGFTAAEIRERTPGVLEAFWSNPVENPPPGARRFRIFIGASPTPYTSGVRRWKGNGFWWSAMVASSAWPWPM